MVGNKKNIPEYFINDDNVILKGNIKHNEVIELLKKTKYYISTTKMENSFNAASEGIIFADESYISDIEPHRELLENETYKILSIPNLSNKVLNVKKINIEGKNLKLWNDIILEMIEKTKI